jgi:hypothetical protein
MTSQQLGDLALEEHRAVMAALLRSCIKQPTAEQYEAQLVALREVMECQMDTKLPSA